MCFFNNSPRSTHALDKKGRNKPNYCLHVNGYGSSLTDVCHIMAAVPYIGRKKCYTYWTGHGFVPTLALVRDGEKMTPVHYVLFKPHLVTPSFRLTTGCPCQQPRPSFLWPRPHPPHLASYFMPIGTIGRRRRRRGAVKVDGRTTDADGRTQ